MATGTLTITANVTGTAAGSWSFNSSRNLPATVQSEQIVALIVGSVVVTIPAGSTELLIVPPNASYPQPNPLWGGTLTLKGVSGDTGTPISNAYPLRLPWDSGNVPGSITLTATATGSLTVITFQMLSTGVELVGFGLVTYAAYGWHHLVGWLAGGLFLLVIGFSIDDESAALSMRRIVIPFARRSAARKARRLAKKAG